MSLAEIKNTIAQYPNTVKLHPDFMFRGQADSSWNL